MTSPAMDVIEERADELRALGPADVPGSVLHASALTDLDVTPPPGPMVSMI